ncbi:MAG: creatininase family protein [Clostridia bacterium]|nr:creatininase family protein [Clostridia bacterium]
MLLPNLYFGTECARDETLLKNIGFPTDAYIVGQDFPKNSLPSLYAREEIFAMVVGEYIRMLEAQGFKMVVLVNGHGAYGQLGSLNRLAKQYNGEGKIHVMVGEYFGAMEIPGDSGGHATLAETSIMMALTDSVDLQKLPPQGVPLMNTDWGITDGLTYAGKNTKGYVLADPRNATAKIGQKCIRDAIALLTQKVKEEYETL